MAGSRSRNLQKSDVFDWLESQWLHAKDVSATRIVNELGGSTSTAQKFLDEWRESKRTAAEQYPMPPELSAKFMGLMSEAFAGLNHEARAQLERAESVWEQHRQVWVREQERFESEIAGKDRALEEAEQVSHDLRDENATIRRELKETLDKVSAQGDSIISLNEALKSQKLRTQEAIEAAGREEDRMMVQLDVERTAKKKAQQELAKGLEAARKQATEQAREFEQRIEAIRSERDEANQKLAAAEATVESQGQAIASHESHTRKLEERLETATEKYAVAQGAVEASHDKANDYQSQIKTLQGELATARDLLTTAVESAEARVRGDYEERIAELKDRISEQKMAIEALKK